MTQQQLERLVNEDFPWLWAIRQEWCTIHSKVKVIQVPDLGRAPSFLYRSGPDRELWAKGEIVNNCLPGMQVRKALTFQSGADSSWNWARRLLFGFCVADRIDFFVEINGIPYYRETVIIYRPPNKAEGWRPLLEKIANRR